MAKEYTMIEVSRRSFLQLSSMAAASGSVRAGWWSAVAPIGVQLYTVRNEVMTDLPGTLASIRKIGFSMVESFAGMHARPAKELRSMVEDAGLKLPSAHFAYDTLEPQLEYAHDLGVSYMVCAMLPKTMWTRDGFKQAATGLNKVGALAKAMKIKLCFHNHNFEFQPLPSVNNDVPPDPHDTGLKILLDNTDPALVGWEEDCYWVAEGGQDPLTVLQKNKSRVAMLHLKDRRADAVVTYAPGKPAQYFTEIGTGTIDWGPIVKIARNAGKPMFIEQDTTAMPALDSLALSYKNLQKYLA
jgi:sugar phosphate isomerase/epimerase